MNSTTLIIILACLVAAWIAEHIRYRLQRERELAEEEVGRAWEAMESDPEWQEIELLMDPICGKHHG